MPDSSIDSSIDSPIDAPPGDLCAVPTTVTSDMSLTSGEWFIADRGSQRAVKENAGVIRGTSGDPDTSMEASYTDLFLTLPASTTFPFRS